MGEGVKSPEGQSQRCERRGEGEGGGVGEGGGHMRVNLREVRGVGRLGGLNGVGEGVAGRNRLGYHADQGLRPPWHQPEGGVCCGGEGGCPGLAGGFLRNTVSSGTPRLID